VVNAGELACAKRKSQTDKARNQHHVDDRVVAADYEIQLTEPDGFKMRADKQRERPRSEKEARLGAKR